jgi:hypothetical protein
MNGIANPRVNIQSLHIIHKSLIKKNSTKIKQRVNNIGTHLNKNSSQNVNFSSEDEGFQFSEYEISEIL